MVNVVKSRFMAGLTITFMMIASFDAVCGRNARFRNDFSRRSH